MQCLPNFKSKHEAYRVVVCGYVTLRWLSVSGGLYAFIEIDRLDSVFIDTDSLVVCFSSAINMPSFSVS
jgi:hypothetical protein